MLGTGPARCPARLETQEVEHHRVRKVCIFMLLGAVHPRGPLGYENHGGAGGNPRPDKQLPRGSRRAQSTSGSRHGPVSQLLPRSFGSMTATTRYTNHPGREPQQSYADRPKSPPMTHGRGSVLAQTKALTAGPDSLWWLHR